MAARSSSVALCHPGGRGRPPLLCASWPAPRGASATKDTALRRWKLSGPPSSGPSGPRSPGSSAWGPGARGWTTARRKRCADVRQSPRVCGRPDAGHGGLGHDRGCHREALQHRRHRGRQVRAAHANAPLRLRRVAARAGRAPLHPSQTAESFETCEAAAMRSAVTAKGSPEVVEVQARGVDVTPFEAPAVRPTRRPAWGELHLVQTDHPARAREADGEGLPSRLDRDVRRESVPLVRLHRLGPYVRRGPDYRRRGPRCVAEGVERDRVFRANIGPV